MCTFIPSFWDLPHTQPPFQPSRSSQHQAELPVLCSSFPLSVLYVVVYVRHCCSFSSSHPLLPALCPQILPLLPSTFCSQQPSVILSKQSVPLLVTILQRLHISLRVKTKALTTAHKTSQDLSCSPAHLLTPLSPQTSSAGSCPSAHPTPPLLALDQRAPLGTNHLDLDSTSGALTF